MITQKTVFIIGAGANQPYGFPTGKVLKTWICDIPTLEKVLTAFPLVPNNQSRETQIKIMSDARDLSIHFRNSPTLSIDAYLSMNCADEDFVKIGKIAIISMILHSETISSKNSMLPEQDWYQLLFQKMIKGIEKRDGYKDLCQNKISFITFNYDRSLEYYFYKYLINTWHKANLQEKIESGEISFSELCPFKFLHVYGGIAPLPFERKENSVEFGGSNVKSVSELIGNIRTIHESEKKENLDYLNDLNEIKQEIRIAEKIFFLGFGYAEENLKVLGIPNEISFNSQDKRIYGTAFNVAEKDRKSIIKRLYKRDDLKRSDSEYQSFFEWLYNFKPVTCYELLQEHL